MKYHLFKNGMRWCVLTAVLGGMLISSQTVFGKEEAKYSKVRIQISSERDLTALADIGLVFDHVQARENAVEVVLNDWEMRQLQQTAVGYDIVVDDLAAEYRSRPQPNVSELKSQLDKLSSVQGFEFGSMGGYYTLAEIVSELDEMVSLYPNLITAKQSIGTSIEERSIWMVKISDNPNVDEGEEEVLFTSLMHAREPQSMANNLYFMWYLLENYGTDAVATFLVDNREIYFVPCLNPDGYFYNEQTNPNGGGFWRKNRRNNGDGTFGVDINRNFDYQWGYNNQGSSPNPGSSTYRGTSPASEPETQALQNFAIDHVFTMAFNNHSVAGSYNFPWGYEPNFFTPDHDQFVAFSQQMSIFNNYRYGTPWQNLGYVTNGYSNDWFYGEQSVKNKTFSWTVEAGGSGFWPSQNEIVPLCIEALYGNFVLANGVSGGMPPVVDITATPDDPPVIIPSSGGSFDFDITLSNNTNSTWSVDFWTFATFPNGRSTDALLAPTSVQLEPGATFTNTYTQIVPPIDATTITYNARVGVFPDVIAGDSFNFTVTTSPSLAAASDEQPRSEDWVVFEAGTTPPTLSETVPEVFALGQNYPNPFNPQTTISYQVPQESAVKITIYDLTGRVVRELVNQRQTAGSHTAVWDGTNKAGAKVASGVYLYQMKAGEFVQTRKLTLMK